ncbi:acetate--CoA ligase family protein [Patescibacteria group bacterium]|nr:acetate--CoA ligase family protein [Patescibacteria group bacterium]MBU1673435.1 acetate--CoA ligase family protein [Patescibacteria group bacterium]MBU1963364.1 acetate--CoA ligase family protein [Patescibacteria group bacterium]
MLDFIFQPKSIAVIGASTTKGKLGHDILNNIKKFGYSGPVYPVNPKARTILGYKTYKSVKSVKGPIDVALIIVPASIVNAVLKECGEKKIKAVVIISAGFKEMGGDGVKREEEIKRTAIKYGIKIIGPNCLGFINPHKDLNASFASGMPNKGNVGFVSQSGAMAVAMLDWAYNSQVGFSKVITVGNKAGISELELLDYLGRDKDTKVIAMYLESIIDGREFMQRAAKVTRKKPVIVLKAGRSEYGQKAVSSHTGSLAGSDAAVDAAFRQCGVIRAGNVEDLFDLCKGFSMEPLPDGPNTCIVTNAGGPGIMASDALADTNLKLADLDESTKKKLKKNLPEAASVQNPVDIIGDAMFDRYKTALETVIDDPGVDSILTILTPQTMTEEDETARHVAKLSHTTNKPLLTSFMGGEDANSGRQILNHMDIPNYEYPWRAIYTLDKMYDAFLIKQKKGLAYYTAKHKKINKDPKYFQLKTIDAEKILLQYGIPVEKSKLITDPKKIDEFPVAMKIASRDIVHKMASGGIKINIHNIHQARIAYKEIVRDTKKPAKKRELDGILVQPMMDKGEEIIIGMKRDPHFGPVILFGLGGSFVEVLKDISLRIAPFNRPEAMDMIKQVASYEIIKDYDTKLIADTLVKVSHMAMDYEDITEMDINPMIVYKKGGKVVDVRMLYK